MRVRATANHVVPMAHDPRHHITAAEPVAVPDSLYYRRRIADGSLTCVDDGDTPPAAAPAEPPRGDDAAGPVSDSGVDPRNRPAKTTRNKGSHA